MPRGIRGQQIADGTIESVDIKDGSLTFADFDANEINWKEPVADEASLPTTNNVLGDARVALAEVTLHLWDGNAWQSFVTSSYSTTAFNTDFAAKTTDDLTEGTTNKYFYTHNHDDLYYTETETDTLLSGKSDTTHNHDTTYYTQVQVDGFLSGKSDTTHSHDDVYYTETEVDTLLSGKSDTTHSHDDVYFTETEIVTNYYDKTATDTLLANKSVITHEHDDIYYTETEMDTMLADYLPLTGGTITGNITVNGTLYTNSSQTSSTYNFDISTAADASNSSYIRLFRSTNNTNGAYFAVLAADGTSTIAHRLYSDGTGYHTGKISFQNDIDIAGDINMGLTSSIRNNNGDIMLISDEAAKMTILRSSDTLATGATVAVYAADAPSNAGKIVLYGDITCSGAGVGNGTLTALNGITGPLTGNASTATKIQTARTISLNGHVSGSVSFDGSGDANIFTSISGVTTYNLGTVNVTAATEVPLVELDVFDAGSYILEFRMSAGYNESSNNIYWATRLSGIFSLESHTNMYNSAPSEKIYMSGSCHHRTVAMPEFYINSDASNGNYGDAWLYVVSPTTGTFEGVTIKIRRLL